jgi:hypothetical protein
MELEFKNPMIKKELDDFANMNSGMMKLLRNSKCDVSLERASFGMITGYLFSLLDYIEMAEMMFDNKYTLDLTYKTVKHLTPILGLQYFDYIYKHKMDKEKAVGIAKKTLAAYLTVLCMNEHMCFPTISKMDNINEIMDMSEASGKNPDDSWMGFTIKVGTKEEIDLIKEVGTAVKITSKGDFRIRVSHIVEIYKRMCGVDLYEYGIEDYELADE